MGYRSKVGVGAAVVVVAVALGTGTASAQDEDYTDPTKFTPPGYEFCGWKDYENGGWALEWEERLSGASLVLFARGMTCQTARRNQRRVRFNRQSRPQRAGYECVSLEFGEEYIDYRCSKKGRPRVAFRVQTGA